MNQTPDQLREELMEDTLAFSALRDVRPMIETLPLDEAREAFARMMDGKAHFRMVLVNGKD
jgi:D-arabinose 1-dehydrogenase-like Zn-dependent alcohol dehydrogenase